MHHWCFEWSRSSNFSGIPLWLQKSLDITCTLVQNPHPLKSPIFLLMSLYMLVWVKPFWYTIHLLNPNLYMPVYVFLFYLLKILNQVCVCVCVCERERERERERKRERESLLLMSWVYTKVSHVVVGRSTCNLIVIKNVCELTVKDHEYKWDSAPSGWHDLYELMLTNGCYYSPVYWWS